MQLRSVHISALSLSISSVYASLPYSIPDLGHERLYQRDTILALSSNSQTAASSSLLSSTNILSDSDSSTSRHTTLNLAPFPTGSNSTSTLSATGGLTRDSSNIFSSLLRTTETSATNTPLDSVIASKTTLSPSLSGTSNNTILASTSSTVRPIENPVVTMTVTPSNGAPIVITKTVTPTPPLASISSTQTLRPSQAPAPVDGPRAKFPSALVFDVVVDGLTYPLPNPDQPPIEIMLMDGSIAQLLAGKVTLRGQTLNIPNDLSAAQPITTGGQSITAQPGTSKQPDQDDNDDGGGGPFAFLAGLAGVAGGAALALGGAATSAASFASGAAGVGGAAAGTLATTFSGAVGGANNVVSALNGIQQAFPAGELSKAGMNTFSNAQNLGRGSMAWMQSVGNMLQGFDNLKPDQQQKVRDNIWDYAKPNGPLAQAAKALEAVSEFPWEEELPKTNLPSATAKPEPTQSAQVTRTALTQSTQVTRTALTQSAQGTSFSISSSTSTNPTSSSATPSATEGPQPYYFSTKQGTPVDTFQKFVQELDGGLGKTDIRRFRQTYRTNLTSTQAERLRERFPFLRLAYADVHDPKELDFVQEEFNAIPRHRIRDQELHESVSSFTTEPKSIMSPDYQPISPRAPITGGDTAPYWKKTISSPFRPLPLSIEERDAPYVADDSGGRGVTIYILDDGFDTTDLELAAAGRTVNAFFVQNEDAFPPDFLVKQQIIRRNAFLETPRLGSTTGHGTRMAIVAAGKTWGIAPNANLHLLKIRGEWNRGTTRTLPNEAYATQLKALEVAFDEIQGHVEDRLALDSSAKSVINMSWGIPVDDDRENLFRDLLDWCESRKVTIVNAAGNYPEKRLHQTLPQKLGTSENGLITVGGVERDGTRYVDTTTGRPGQGGHISVWAPARDIRVPSWVPNPIYESHTGTSQASAIVAGLAAYFYAAPGLGMLRHPDIPPPHENMKKFIVGHAWTRVLPDQLGDLPSLDVVYNLARGDTMHPDDPCAIQFGKRDGKPISACSISPSATNSRTSMAASTFTTMFVSSSVASRQPSTSTALSSSSSPTASSQQPIETVSTSLNSFSVLSSQVSILTASSSSSNPPASSQQPSSTTSSSSSSTPASSKQPTLLTSTISPPAPTSSQQPNPITSSSIPPPEPIATPTSDKCRIYVNEYDDVDPNNHEEQVWNASIYPDTGSALKDNSYMCMTGVDGGDAGVDVPCEPIGETFHLGRDADNVLRFIRGKETWTSADAKCRIVKDWWLPHDNQKEIRKRETECKFECKIDWAKPPTINVF